MVATFEATGVAVVDWTVKAEAPAPARKLAEPVLPESIRKFVEPV